MDTLGTSVVGLSARELETVIKEYYTARGLVVNEVDFTTDPNLKNSVYEDLTAVIELNIGEVKAQK